MWLKLIFHPPIIYFSFRNHIIRDFVCVKKGNNKHIDIENDTTHSEAD